MQNPTHSYRSPVLLSRFTMAALGISGLLEAFAVIIGVAQVAAPGKNIPLDGGESASIWIMLQGLIALAGMPVYIATIVLFLVWLFRTYVNLPALDADSNEFTPGWAVGWWFVPFANLVKPFQAVRSVWSESDPEYDPDHGAFSSYQAGAPGYMSLWWAFWIISNIAAYITGRMYEPNQPDSILIVGYFFIVSGTLRIIAAGLAIKVVNSITERQEMRNTRIGTLTGYMPPPPPSFGNFEIRQ